MCQTHSFDVINTLYIADISYNGWQLSIKAIYTLLDQRKHAAIE